MNDSYNPQVFIDELRAALGEANNRDRELAERVGAIENTALVGVREAIQALQQRADDLQQRIAFLEVAKAKRKPR
jgi:hypothetical protein